MREEGEAADMRSDRGWQGEISREREREVRRADVWGEISRERERERKRKEKEITCGERKYGSWKVE